MVRLSWILMLLGTVLAGCSRVIPPPPLSHCHFGAYRLPDGQVMALRHREGATLRYVFMDGRTGSLEPDGEAGRYTAERSGESPAMTVALPACGERKATITLDDGASVTAERIVFDEKEVRFDSDGVELVGRLVLPPGNEPVPFAVLLHGSERYSGIYGYHWPYLLAAHGVGAFVYDKRGTGRSQGEYTQDFHVLAADAIAAARQARVLAGARLAELGYFGGSQGGWIAPLAAERGGADFVVVAYGFAESALAEDREEVTLELRAAGNGEDVLRKARELTDATGVIMASGLKDGWDELDELKERYREEPWFDQVEGEFTGDFLRWPGWIVRIVAGYWDVGTSWDYEPLPTIAAVDARQLWVLAGEDREAPSETTVALLLGLQPTKPELDVVVFPEADHGILVGERDADGELQDWRYAEGYHRLVVEWIQTGEVHRTHPGLLIYAGRN